MHEQIIHLDQINPLSFYGVNEAKFELVKEFFPQLKIVGRGNEIKVFGSENEIQNFESKISTIIEYLQNNENITNAQIQDFLKSKDEKIIPNVNEVLLYGNNGKSISAKTDNQKLLVKEYQQKDMIFAIGPAGSGKTYTAIALAVLALKNREVKKIILSRPAVEAGEKLGFLPGDYKEKLDPYLMPLYDALTDMIPQKKLESLIAEGIIQIAPLAFMRGRTLEDAFVILDEAQNTTKSQIKMFLTRMGRNSKFLITGDVTQIDLPRKEQSGLIDSVKLLKHISDISFIYFDEKDIIRHELVKKIVKAYDTN